ncbi:MAG: methionyl-tRNA formyltransferase [Pseudomonadota bacterium]|nr:methionyl-tRNA formyltransferase [Pseudomonadota bacterium]
MRVAIVGQQKFGRTVVDSFLDRGHTVAGVFCAPDQPGLPADPIKTGAMERGVPVYQLGSLKTEAACDMLRALEVELAVMAYVLQFVPAAFAAVPLHGTIQYHPSLLPRYRGPSSINWPIIRGDTRTGLSIFRPTDGLDEGPVLLQKETSIGPDDTLGSVYFDRLFPMGVEAILEAADLVTSGRGAAVTQDESKASYEGWCRTAEARINWHNHVDLVHNLIRGCDPAPGAWTLCQGKKLQLFDTRKYPLRSYSPLAGAVGKITAIGPRSMSIGAQGGQIEIGKVRLQEGDKIPASRLCADLGLTVGTLLGG